MGTAHHSTTQHPVHAHPMQPYAHLQSCAHQQRCMHTSSIACTPAAPHARSQPPSHCAPLCSAVGTCSPAASHAQPHPSLSLYPTTEQGRPIPAVVLFHFSFINLYKKRLHVPQAADIPPPAHPERSHQRGHGDPNPVQGPWPPGWRTGRGGGGGAENTPKPPTVPSGLIRSPTSEGFGGKGAKSLSLQHCGAEELLAARGRSGAFPPPRPYFLRQPLAASPIMSQYSPNSSLASSGSPMHSIFSSRGPTHCGGAEKPSER